jgi:hypothetical protein
MLARAPGAPHPLLLLLALVAAPACSGSATTRVVFNLAAPSVQLVDDAGAVVWSAN